MVCGLLEGWQNGGYLREALSKETFECKEVRHLNSLAKSWIQGLYAEEMVNAELLNEKPGMFGGAQWPGDSEKGRVI